MAGPACLALLLRLIVKMRNRVAPTLPKSIEYVQVNSTWGYMLA